MRSRRLRKKKLQFVSHAYRGFFFDACTRLRTLIKGMHMHLSIQYIFGTIQTASLSGAENCYIVYKTDGYILIY